MSNSTPRRCRDEPQSIVRGLHVGAVVAVLGSLPGRAQLNSTLTDKDRAEIQALSTTYGRALFTCKGEEYADLFATPGGYFGSGSPRRGA